MWYVFYLLKLMQVSLQSEKSCTVEMLKDDEGEAVAVEDNAANLEAVLEPEMEQQEEQEEQVQLEAAEAGEGEEVGEPVDDPVLAEGNDDTAGVEEA